MIFRQLFDRESSTFSYVLGSSSGRALIIDPVFQNIPTYIKLLRELKLALAFAIDTHIHADHRSGIGELANLLKCISINGSPRSLNAMRSLRDNETISMDEIELLMLATPGHTDDSFCLLLTSQEPNYIFTGDTLFIKGNGRTDFQNGSANELYRSVKKRLFNLREDTFVFPGHDYNGFTNSTIGEEVQFNPRFANKREDEFVAAMESLDLPRPKLMDEVVPLNENCGLEL